jgi:hypothetical protein
MLCAINYLQNQPKKKTPLIFMTLCLNLPWTLLFCKVPESHLTFLFIGALLNIYDFDRLSF